MKKLLAIVLSLLLVLAAVSALADSVTFTTKYFSLELPDGWIVDTDDLEDESEEGLEALGFFSAPDEIGLVAGAYLVYYEELKDMALWNSSEEELKEYAEAVMESFEDENPEYLGVVKAGNVPFVLFRCTDSDGEYLYADTITNGYSIQFEVCVGDQEGEKFYPLTDEYIGQFKMILATFKPAA